MDGHGFDLDKVDQYPHRDIGAVGIIHPLRELKFYAPVSYVLASVQENCVECYSSNGMPPSKGYTVCKLRQVEGIRS